MWRENQAGEEKRREKWTLEKEEKDTDHDSDTDGKAALEFQFDLMSFLRTM